MSEMLPEEARSLAALVKRVDASNPAPADVAALRQRLIDDPRALDLIGNFTNTLQSKILADKMYSPVVRLGIETQCEAMRAGLGWAESSTAERLLIDHVILCWLRHNEVEWRYGNVTKGEYSIPVGAYWEKRLSASQKRYLRAVESLAKVRRLLRREAPVIAVLNQFNGAVTHGQTVR